MIYLKLFSRKISVFSLAIGVMLAFCSAVSATTVTLAWDANSEPDVTGYKLHYGTTRGNYAAVVDAGANTQYAVQNLEPGKTYYFAVTAYNNAGLESDLSGEISQAVATFQITTAPSSRVATSGSSVTLSVETTNGNLTYQWLKDGVAIPNAGGPTYTINKLDPANVGAYAVRISDGIATVTTPAATVSSIHMKLPRSLVIHGTQGSKYHIFYKNDLGSEEWTPAAEVNLDSGSYEFNDTSATNVANRFYQVTPVL